MKAGSPAERAGPQGGETRLLESVHIAGFRSIRDASFRPGPLSALVGEPGTGKSNLLTAIRATLDPHSEPLGEADVTRDGDSSISIRLDAADGSSISLEGIPPSMASASTGAVPPALYLPARLRAGPVVAPSEETTPGTERATDLIGQAVAAHAHAVREAHPPGSTEAAHGLVEGLEAWNRASLKGMIVLIEEPELFLPPQTQRYLYRLLRGVAAMGNQILYSTHSPSFLNVGRLDELVFTEHVPGTGTRLIQPEPLSTDDEFRAYSEFDAARSELFLARAAILVEGLTEMLALPFVFNALGYDADRERISIVECGGKSNIPLVARISKTVGIPYLTVYDRDAPEGTEPSEAEQQLNELVAEVTGTGNSFELAPDFEGVAGLRGQRHKPARAWRTFAGLPAADVPAPLASIVERAVSLARR